MKNKSLFSLILSFVVLALLLFTFYVAAEESLSGKCGTNLNYILDADGTLTISGNGEMTTPSSYTYLPWHYKRDMIKKVIISDGVTSISDYAFLNCTALTSVTIPNSVTTIGHSAFYNCKKLTSISLPGNTTRIGNWTFSYCTALTSITIPDSVTSIGRFAFYSCSTLSKITVDSNNKYYSGDTRGALFNKSKTVLIQYPTGNISASYTIPSTVTDIESYAFASCKSLKRASIPDSVTNIKGKAFYNTACYNNSANWENGVLYIGNHLIEAAASLSGNYTVRAGTKSIADDAFASCSGLGAITIPDSVTSIGASALHSCEEIIVNSNNQYYSSDKYGVLFNKDKTTLIKYPSKSTSTSYQIPSSVTSIGDYAFSYCNNLENISFGYSLKLKSIGAGAFYECNNITSLTIPAGTLSIGSYAFDSCTGLTDIRIHDSVTSIGNYAFFSCASLAVSGYDGSVSQSYAKDNGMKFITLIPIYGDILGDGKVDVSDAITELKLIAANNLSSLTKSQLIASDVNCDEKIDVSDVIRILKHIANPGIPLGPNA